jgi:hypothetical protein
MTAFLELKKSSKSMYDKIVAETNKIQNTKTADDRFWKPEVDKAGNGSAILRFLPPATGEDLPYVRLFSHGFQGPGGWYIENSLTTIGEKDPCGDFNSQLWNNGTDSGKQQAREQKRRLNYVSNVYIVKDPAHPEREGNVYLFKYGKKIFDKLNDMMHPEFDDETPVNPFDLWEGANLRMKIRNVEGYRNYDKSEFESSSPLSDDDKELEKIWNSQYALNEFTNAKNFKSYDELKIKLNRVLGLSTTEHQEAAPASASSFSKEEADLPWNNSVTEPVTANDDDDMSFFKSLAEED